MASAPSIVEMMARKARSLSAGRRPGTEGRKPAETGKSKLEIGKSGGDRRREFYWGAVTARLKSCPDEREEKDTRTCKTCRASDAVLPGVKMVAAMLRLQEK